MSEIPDFLPITPLEGPVGPHAHAHFTEYWPRQLQVDPALGGAEMLSRVVQEGCRYIESFSRHANREYIQIWDRSLGPFNHLEGATRPLLLGAAHILRANSKKSNISLESFKDIANDEDIRDAFLTLADKLGDMACENPSGALVTAGQMVHKVGWLYPSTETMSDLFEVASRAYTRVREAEKPWDLDMHHASQYRADIQFHKVSQGIRRAIRAHQDVTPFQVEARALLLEQVGDLFRMSESPVICQAGNIGGMVFEQLGVCAERKMIYLNPDIKGNHPEVRVAFSSEDQPKQPGARKENSSFDQVLSWVTSNDVVIRAEPVQLKTGRSLQRYKLPYHPAIRVVEVKDITLGAMIEAAKGMRQEIINPGTPSHTKAQKRVAEIFSPLLPYRKAA